MLLALATLAATVSPKPAQAEVPVAMKLEFRATSGCPTQPEFLRRLTSRAEVRLVDRAESLRLHVSLETTGSGARGELRAGTDSDDNAREVEARTCEEVADALALIAALMLERTQRTQAARPRTKPTTATPPPQPTHVVPAPRAPTPRALELGLQAVATRPMTSPLLTGAGVSLLVSRSLTWWLSAHYSRNDVVASAHQARFGFGGLLLGIGPPALQLGSGVRLAAALAAEGAFLTAEGVNVDVKSSARRSYWAGGALVRVHLNLTTHLGMFVDLGGFVPLVERRFSTREPYELVGQTSSVAAHAALGFAVSL